MPSEGTELKSPQNQLHRQLVDAALAKGVKIKAGVKVSSAKVDETAIILEDGEEVHGDLIIAADGVHVRSHSVTLFEYSLITILPKSAIRNEVLERTDLTPGPSTGHSAFRLMLTKSDVQNDKIVSSAINDNFRMTSWAGQAKRILVYPVDFDRQLSVTCTHPAYLSDQETSGGVNEATIGMTSLARHLAMLTRLPAYNQKASLDTVLSIYKDFDARLIRLIELADPEGFRVWKLVDMDEIPTWSRHNTVLLGDAWLDIQHPVMR